ncbi:MAG: hypothetical protein DMF14_04900 [Verrucomicrobia bacterium]|nr:MAG: hypothetical protein DME37_03960 [Verrucomicrobiota bacterium]PYL83334.1 MAG: hypothetical protein DMF23_09920 [Verrucomicrobiota bacterium]PYL92161.1 MAG: hypothetical protein DMF14_04900 [Verrucomicrobiota bacterium]TMP90766.1 MAG: DUF2127 domain-containing protein [Verrucomicrobiota bacterium]
MLSRERNRCGVKQIRGRLRVSHSTADLKILRPQHRVRYLKLIALFKIGKGILLLVLGISILFLNSRAVWMDNISDWVADEILLKHSKVVHYLLNRLQAMLAGGGVWRATGFLSLFYSAVLFTEGVGVYLQKRWAEYLMVFATGALIPLEVRHIYYRPSFAAVIILAANCFIVWFLYRVLKREPVHAATTPPEVAVETR